MSFTAENYIVEIEDGKVFYKNDLILSDIDFKVTKDDIIYLVGRTGSGKSSLLKAIYGEIELKNGNGKVVNYNLRKLKRNDLPFLRRKLGIVFQDFQLLQDRTIYDNLEFVLNATGWTDFNKKKQAINDVLEMVGLQTKLHKFPYQLSGGEQQRVAIARALINNPELILADEPTGNLDPETTTEIMNLFYKIHKETNIPLIIATHNYSLIYQFPGTVYMCAYGVITKDDSNNNNKV